MLIDHIYAPNRLSETFVMYNGSTRAPLLYADLNWRDILKKGCENCCACKHAIDGLRIPILSGSVSEDGSLRPNGGPVATMVFEWPYCEMPCPCCCYLPTFKAQMVAEDTGPPIANFLSEGGMKYCPFCIPDAPIVMTDGNGQPMTTLAGTTQPCCNLCKDDSFPRPGNDGSMLQRYWVDACGSGPGQPVGFRRIPICFCPCSGPPVTMQTYEITNRCQASPAVWAGASLFEAMAYPYHTQGGGGGDGGGGGGGGGG